MSSAMTTEKKKLRLRSSDGDVFEVDEVVAMASQTIKHMIEDECVENETPLPIVSSKILSKVLEYCNKHVEPVPKAAEDLAIDDNLKALVIDDEFKDFVVDDKLKVPVVDDELKAWDANFMNVDKNTLYDLILAANYLEVKGLLELTVQTVADMLKGKTVEEMRETFNIKNDFKPEEEEKLWSKYPWAF